MTIIVTTSWDDGHVLDMRLADLLDRYGLGGTFYVAPFDLELPLHRRLMAGQIRELSAKFDIGGHTLTHRRLPTLTPERARIEIEQGKKYLEDVVQSPIDAFCYPGGAYSTEHVRMVKQAGFRYARTVQRYVIEPADDPLQSGTTAQAFRHLLDWRGLGLRTLQTRHVLDSVHCHLNWDDLAIRIFDEMLEEDCASNLRIFHLWGHSWEIEAYDDWRRVHRVFGHIGGRAEVQYQSNIGCQRTE